MPQVLIILGLILIAVAASARLVRKVSDALPPNRRIVSRMPAMDGGGGEVLLLECEHSVRMIMHNRQAIPCQECQEEGLRE